MKRSIVTILQYVFFLGLGVLFVWLSVRKIDHEQWLQIKDALQKSRKWLIAPAFFMLLLSHYSRALRWRILMEPLGYQPTRFNTFAAVMIGYLVNAGVPRLGEVVKCTLLARYENVRADRLVGTIVMERAVDVVCLLVAFIAALLYQGHVIGDYVSSLFGGFFRNQSGETSVTKIILYGGGLLLVLLLLYIFLKRFGHIDAVGKIKNVAKGILHGLQSIRFIRHKGWFLFHSLLIWLLYLASTTVGIYALRETAHLGIGGGLTTLAVGSVAMIITPGGIGAYPLLVSKLMGLYNIDETTIGNALGWLLWTVQTIIIIIGGLVSSALFSTTIKINNPVKPEQLLATKILPLSDLLQKAAEWREAGKTIAFTNGCFDILHAGHVASLSEAAGHGDILVVALNSDASVKALKGENRPLNNEGARAVVMAALSMVDAVTIFNESTPRDLIVALMPDVLVKGGDYKVEDIAGAKEILENGGRVVINPIIEGFSTTAIINKMKPPSSTTKEKHNRSSL